MYRPLLSHIRARHADLHPQAWAEGLVSYAEQDRAKLLLAFDAAVLAVRTAEAWLAAERAREERPYVVEGARLMGEVLEARAAFAQASGELGTFLRASGLLAEGDPWP